MRFIILLALLVSCGRGPAGKSGLNGKDGGSCRVESVSNGARIICDDGSQSVILNGEDGVSEVFNIIDPCGDDVSEFDEILLKTNSGIIAYLEDRGRRILVKLSPGNYVTGDRQLCQFRVNSDDSITEL